LLTCVIMHKRYAPFDLPTSLVVMAFQHWQGAHGSAKPQKCSS
jgi:hypothetical protein